MLEKATRHVGSGSRTTLSGGNSQGAELTRVGAIMGTPLYMSPEQCASKSLDARSEFSGDMPSVMREHLENSPPYLRTQNKKIKDGSPTS